MLTNVSFGVRFNPYTVQRRHRRNESTAGAESIVTALKRASTTYVVNEKQIALTPPLAQEGTLVSFPPQRISPVGENHKTPV